MQALHHQLSPTIPWLAVVSLSMAAPPLAATEFSVGRTLHGGGGRRGPTFGSQASSRATTSAARRGLRTSPRRTGMKLPPGPSQPRGPAIPDPDRAGPALKTGAEGGLQPGSAPTGTDAGPSHKLTVEEVLGDLVSDSIVAPSVAKTLLQTVTTKDRAERHALEIVADAKIHHAGAPERLITLEELTFWLAKRSGLEYLRIDPLKIDAPNVGDMITASYAAWNRILPVLVTAEHVVLATSEPYLTDWIERDRADRQARHRSRRQPAGHRALPGPSSTTSPRSIKGAQEASTRAPWACATSSSWSSSVSAASSTPTTATSSTSSTGSGSTPSSSAPPTSTSSRGATSASCASASTASCTRSTRSRRR